VPSSLPVTFNITSRGDQFISGVFLNEEFTDYIYVFGDFSGVAGDILGTYGIDASGDFRFRFTYDWTEKSAEILPNDSIANPVFTGSLPTPPVGPSGGDFVGTGTDTFDGLISSWPLDEGSPRLDYGPQANHLSDIGGVPKASGVTAFTSFAAHFISSGTYLQRTHNNSLSPGDTDFTIKAWASLADKDNDQTIVEKPGEYSIGYDKTLDRFDFTVVGASGSTTVADELGVAPSISGWHMIFCWHNSDQQTINIKVNNKTIAGKFHFDNIEQVSNHFVIGSGDTFNGRVDSVDFWDRSLSAVEWGIVYNGGQGRQWPWGEAESTLSSGIVASYWLNEQTGETRYDRVGTNHLVDNNNVERIIGVIGSGAHFTRADTEYLDTLTDPVFNILDNNWMISVWASLDSKAQDCKLVTKWGTAAADNEWSLEYDQSTDQFKFIVQASGGSEVEIQSSGFSPVTDEWYNIVAWHDANLDTINLQINSSGGFKYNAPFVGPVQPTNTNFTLGALSGAINPSTNNLDGSIDSVNIWDRVLDKRERSQVYSEGSGVEWKFLQRDVIVPPPPPPTSSGTAETTIPSGLTSFWNLDEPSGIRLDSMGPGHLNDINAVGRASGIGTVQDFVAFAANFDFNNTQYLSLSDGATETVNFGDEDFTFIAWVKLADISDFRPIISKWRAGGNNRQYFIDYDGSSSNRFRITASKLGTIVNQVVEADSHGAAVSGQWYMVAVWHDSVGDNLYIQIDNGPIDSGFYSDGFTVLNADFEIGALSSAARYFDGDIALVGAWDRVLTANELTSMYNLGSGIQHNFGLASVPSSGIVAAWPLNEFAASGRYDRARGKVLEDNNSVARTTGIGTDELAADFDTTNWLQMSSSHSDLQIGDDEMTIGLRAQVLADVDMTFVEKRNEYKLEYSADENGFVFTAYDTSVAPSSVIASGGTYGDVLDTWHSLLCWHDPTNDTINMEVNGSGILSADFTTGTNTEAFPLTIGSGVSGYIDGLHYWDHALDSNYREDWFANCNEHPFFTVLDVPCPEVGSGLLPPEPPGSGPPPPGPPPVDPVIASGLYSGLLSFWNFNESSGSGVDSHGPNHLRPSGTISRASGVTSETIFARELERSNTEYFAQFANDDLTIGNNTRAWAGWFWLDSQPAGQGLSMIAKFDGASDLEFHLQYIVDTDTISWGVRRQDNASTTSTTLTSAGISTDEWHHIVCTHDAVEDRIELILDNFAASGDTQMFGGARSSSIDYLMGARNGSATHYWPGRLDAWGLWNRTLTVDEIGLLYASGFGIEFPFGVDPVERPSGAAELQPFNDQVIGSGLLDNLVSFWNMEEGTGLVRMDSHGFFHLSDNATVGQASGIVGEATDHIRTNNEFLDIVDKELMHVASGDFGFAGWFYLDDKSQQQDLYSKWNASADERQYSTLWRSSDDRMVTFLSDDGTAADTTLVADAFGKVSDGDWHFIAVWRDTGSGNLYISVDDSSLDQEYLDYIVHSGTEPLDFGALSSISRYTDGKLDAWGFWHKAFTLDEVNYLYNNGFGRQYPFENFTSAASGIQAYWPLNEETGQTRRDRTGNNNHLTDNNSDVERRDGMSVNSSGCEFTTSATEYLSRTDDASLQIANNNKTFVFWVKLKDTSANYQIVSKNAGSPNRDYHCLYNLAADRFRFVLFDTGDAAHTVDADRLGSPSADTWYMVTIYHDADNDNMGIQINDLRANIIDMASGGVQNTSAEFRIGIQSNGSFPLNGFVDAVGVWDRVLPSGDLETMYNNGDGLEYPFVDQVNKLSG
jgi:hypothetical protein